MLSFAVSCSFLLCQCSANAGTQPAGTPFPPPTPPGKPADAFCEDECRKRGLRLSFTALFAVSVLAVLLLAAYVFYSRRLCRDWCVCCTSVVMKREWH